MRNHPFGSLKIFYRSFVKKKFWRTLKREIEWLPGWRTIVGKTLFGISLVVVICFWSAAELYREWLFFFNIIAICTVAISLPFSVTDRRIPPEFRIYVMLLLLVVEVIAAALQALHYAFILNAFRLGLQHVAPEWWSFIRTDFLIGGLVLLGGVFLYWIRATWRATYGALEVLSGIGFGTIKFHGISQDWGVGLITAGIYLVVRGMDNLVQGLEPRTNDPVRKQIRRFRARHQIQLRKVRQLSAGQN